jgi:hypothetical protein
MTIDVSQVSLGTKLGLNQPKCRFNMVLLYVLVLSNMPSFLGFWVKLGDRSLKMIEHVCFAATIEWITITIYIYMVLFLLGCPR